MQLCSPYGRARPAVLSHRHNVPSGSGSYPPASSSSLRTYDTRSTEPPSWAISGITGEGFQIICMENLEFSIQLTHISVLLSVNNVAYRHTFAKRRQCTARRQFLQKKNLHVQATHDSVSFRWTTAVYFCTYSSCGMRWRSRLRNCSADRNVAASTGLLRLFTDFIFPAALWPWGGLLTEMSTGDDS